MNSPETANQAETPEPAKGTLDELGALLSGEDVGNNDASDAPETTPETAAKGKPETLKDLAETLGLEDADIYAIKVPFDQGNNEAEPRTLGEIKDLVADVDEFEVTRLAWEEKRTERENDLTRSMQELSEIVSMLPKSAISDELIQAVTRRREETLDRESRLTKQVIPDWESEAVEEKDRSQMREHLGKWGYPKAYLDSITDHTTLRYIRENMLREQRIERALANVKTVKRPGVKPSGRPSPDPAPSRRSARPGSTDDQVSRVAELLRTG